MKIKKKSKSVEEQAEENLNVVKGKNVEKQGRFPDHSEKHLNGECVGMSVGTTVNMGDYESLRVDCWATTEMQSGENMERALNRVSEVLDKKLRLTISFYTESDDD